MTKEKVAEDGDGRKAAVDLLQELGYTWPEILDAPYPLSNEKQSALYSTVIIKYAFPPLSLPIRWVLMHDDDIGTKPSCSLILKYLKKLQNRKLMHYMFSLTHVQCSLSLIPLPPLP